MKFLLKILFAAAAVLPLASLRAQDDMAAVEVSAHRLTDSLYYLQGAGGNIGVSIGADGVFLIDDQFAALTDKIRASVAGISDAPIRFVLNTHYHGDHTGGNANLSNAGVVVIAHDNVRTSLRAGFSNDALNRALTAQERAMLPVMTFSDSLDLFLNRESIHAFHVAPAHTDGDAFVVFRNANVIHTGDVFRTTTYPRVDTNANGTYHGIMAAYETLLRISDDDTRFLPGHGEVSDRAEVASQLEMFRTIRDRVSAGMARGDSLQMILDSAPTAEYDARWSGGDPQAGSALVELVYNELSRMQ